MERGSCIEKKSISHVERKKKLLHALGGERINLRSGRNEGFVVELEE